MSSKPSLLHSALTAWALFTAVFSMLIIYRAAFNPEYQWGLFGVNGVGMSPAYAFIAAFAAWAWALVVLGERRSPLFAPMCVGWNAFLFLGMILSVREFGSTMEFRGDAYGIRLNIAFVGPLLTGILLAASLVLLRRSLKTPVPTVPSPTNRRNLALALGLTPIIALLFFRVGADHTTRDRVAVALIVTQCIAAASAFKIRRLQET